MDLLKVTESQFLISLRLNITFQPSKTQGGFNQGGHLTLTHKGKACQCKTGTKLLSGKVFKIDTGRKREFSFLIWSPPNVRQNPSTLTAAVKNGFLLI